MNHFNQTAYRVLILLKCLKQAPITANDLNKIYEKDPLIGKQASADSIGHYINTLKQLGCTITRPTSKNGYTYRLLENPFTYRLTPEDLKLLSEVWFSIESELDYKEVINWYKWLSSVFDEAENPNRKELKEAFLKETRLVKLENDLDLLQTLETHCKQKELIRINYGSPIQGPRKIDLLPRKLMHQNGLTYLSAQTQERESSSKFRLDRIESVHSLDNPELKKELIKKSDEQQTYIIKVLNCTPDQFDPLTDEDEYSVDKEHPQHMQVTCKTDDQFLLKQKLLSSPHPYEILYPDQFARELEETLKSMEMLYA